MQHPGGRLVAKENLLHALTSLAAPLFYTAAARIHYGHSCQPVAHQVPCILHQKAEVGTVSFATL